MVYVICFFDCPFMSGPRLHRDTASAREMDITENDVGWCMNQSVRMVA